MSVATAEFVDEYTLLPRAPARRLASLIIRYYEHAGSYNATVGRLVELHTSLPVFWDTIFELAPSTLEPLINQDARQIDPDHPVPIRYVDIFGDFYLPLAVSDNDKQVLNDTIATTIQDDPTTGKWEDFVHHRYYDNTDSVELGMFVGTAYRAIGCMFVIEVARTLLHCYCVDLRTRGTKRE